MSADERTGWECRFCSEKLKPQLLVGWRRLLWPVPIRTFRCPHCFSTFQKPAAFVAAIPLVGKLFCEKRGGAANVSVMISRVARRRNSSHRSYVNAGWIVRFARWTGYAESRTTDFLCKTFRDLWRLCLWPVQWFSKKFLRSGDNSLPSFRSKSRIRSRQNDA